MRGQCNKAKGNRTLEVNFRLKASKKKAKELLMSEIGLYHRSMRPIEPETVFGQLKSNNKFNRFTLRSLSKAGVEFGLMAIGHDLRKLAAKVMLPSYFDLLRQFIVNGKHLLKNYTAHTNQNHSLLSIAMQNKIKFNFAA